ncbi:MAG: hypothetical protein V3V61_04620 [Gammaproteobacteria bacterium]
MEENCFVCGKPAKSTGSDDKMFDCSDCDRYNVTEQALGLQGRLNKADNRAKLGYAFYNRKLPNKSFDDERTITEAWLDDVLSDNFELPSPLEQVNNLLRYIGEESKDIGSQVLLIEDSNLYFKIGTREPKSVIHAARLLIEENFVKQASKDTGVKIKVSLTEKGWMRFQKEAKTVFMAMFFENDKVERFRKDCVKPAVESIGYKFISMKDYPKAGSIDDHIRVELRKAQIVIADLTENNEGVYWEAGFAEGNNKLVIYTCEESLFKSKGKKPYTHFDTNHIRTILWNENDFDQVKQEIVDMIKNSLASKS